MFKIFLFLFVSSFICHGSSLDVIKKWPFFKQTFVRGEVQSPINILPENAFNIDLTSLLYYSYWRVDSVVIKMVNRQNALHIHSIPNFDGTRINNAYITGGPLFNSIYTFSHIHVYWGPEGQPGSQHQINSQGYPMEVQMIHYKNEYESYGNAIQYSDGICIISYFGEISEQDNSDMDNFISAVQLAQSPRYNFVSTFYLIFYFLMEVAENDKYYTYPGSITVYPYSQCVTWIVYESTFCISENQLSILRTLYGEDGSFLTDIGRRSLRPFHCRPLYYV